MCFVLSLAALVMAVSLSGVEARVSDGDLPSGVTFVTAVEGIEEYRLHNGLRVLLFPDRAKRTTTVNVTYMVGSLHEGYGETGMAHLLEHLAFKGTPDHPDIPQELSSHGARSNGSTWFDRTNYFETFSASDENLDWALDMEADRMVNSFISAEDLESEMTVVRNEFEFGENNPRRVLNERVYSTAFLWHNYGNTTIGARSDIEGVPIENLMAFYKRWYRPDNAVLVVAGKLEQKRTIDLVQRRFGRLENPDTPLPRPYTVEPAQDGERTVTLRRVGDMKVACVGYHIPSGTHPDYPVLQVMAFLLGDAPAGRLHKALVETRKATSVWARADRFKEPALMFVNAELRVDGNVEGLRDEMLQIIEDFAVNPPNEEEVARAKRNLLRNWEVTMRDSRRAAIRLSEWAAMGDWRLVFLHRDWLEQVTAQDVAQVAGEYFHQSNRTVGMFIPTEGPDRVRVPEPPDLAELLDGYAGRYAMAQGEDFDVSPQNIEDRLQRMTLANGMKVITLPKKTRGETVALSLSLNFGGAVSLRGLKTVGSLTGDMLMRGTTSRTRQEVEDEIASLQISLAAWGRASGAGGRIEATRQTLPDALRLLADVLKNPSFPENEFDQVMESSLKEAEEDRSDPRALADMTLRKHMTPFPKEDPRFIMSPDETVEALEVCGREQLPSFHEKFYGASSGELAVVGDFDAEDVRNLLVELFGDWNCATPYERMTSEYEKRPVFNGTVETPDKESAVFSSAIRVNVTDEHEDYPALVMGNFMIGGGFLNSRLAKRIRQEEGLSYGVRSRFWADAVDQNAWFGGFAIYAPHNDAALLKAFIEEMEKVIVDGFTEAALSEAKSGWLQRREVSRAQDRELAVTLTRRSHDNRSMLWDAGLDEKVINLTPDQILDSVRRHLDPKKMSIIRAGDFEGAREKDSVQTP